MHFVKGYWSVFFKRIKIQISIRLGRWDGGLFWKVLKNYYRNKFFGSPPFSFLTLHHHNSLTRIMSIGSICLLFSEFASSCTIIRSPRFAISWFDPHWGIEVIKILISFKPFCYITETLYTNSWFLLMFITLLIVRIYLLRYWLLICYHMNGTWSSVVPQFHDSELMSIAFIIFEREWISMLMLVGINHL